MNNNSEHISPDLITAYLNGEISRDDALRVETWINHSDENRAIFYSYQKTWKELGDVNPVPDFFNAEMAWDKISARINEAEIKGKVKEVSISSKKQKYNYTALLRIAAVLIPAVLIIYYFINTNHGVETAKNVIKVEKTERLVVAATNKIVREKLPDGTKITINRKSKLTYPEKFNDVVREVTLEGEAFFDVKHDESKPFIIHTDDVNVRVLGTSFNVSSYSEENEVVVYVKTGKVLVYFIDFNTNDSNSVVLLPGNKGIFNKKLRKFKKTKSSEDESMLWMSKQLVFSKTDLSEVFDVLEKYYRVKIKATNKEIKKCRLSATFKEQTVETVLDVIAKSFDLTVSKDKTTYTFDGKGCE
ncbi:MAG: hypothetical protein A2X12_00410 [Bacteroidetes bacterium GWE2_29_8]|nr:MAG: hypothetical protein A2X12_00410 [Bacteroidetes bacterium GWE2_29_8]OFY14846.1 MAG: hypothetical protein A2X02_01535 [Bacteroidetes bacterium GWF2_29_10]